MPRYFFVLAEFNIELTFESLS